MNAIIPRKIQKVMSWDSEENVCKNTNTGSMHK